MFQKTIVLLNKTSKKGDFLNKISRFSGLLNFAKKIIIKKIKPKYSKKKSLPVDD
jgi:hypothetical protein